MNKQAFALTKVIFVAIYIHGDGADFVGNWIRVQRTRIVTENDNDAAFEWIEEVAELRERRAFLRKLVKIKLFGGAILFAYIVFAIVGGFANGLFFELGPLVHFAAVLMFFISACLTWFSMRELDNRERRLGEDAQAWNDYIQAGKPLEISKLLEPFVMSGIVAAGFVYLYLDGSLTGREFANIGSRADQLLKILQAVGIGMLIFISPVFSKFGNLGRYLSHENKGRGGESILSKIKRAALIGCGVVGMGFVAFGLYAILFAPDLLERIKISAF